MAFVSYTDRIKDRSNSAAAQSVSVQKNNNNITPYTDNRPEALLQRRIQRMASDMQQVKTISADSFIPQDLASQTLVAQRENIRIGTGGDREGTLTYVPSGTIKLANGTPFQGIILVLIDIPEQDRKNGYGGMLMKYFMEKVVGNKPCYLDVLAVGDKGLNNEQLETWYKKYGFQTLGYSSTGPVMGANVLVARPAGAAAAAAPPPAAAAAAADAAAGGGARVRLVNYSDSDSDTDEKKKKPDGK